MRNGEGRVNDDRAALAPSDTADLTVGLTRVFGPHRGRDEIALRMLHWNPPVRSQRTAAEQRITTDHSARNVQCEGRFTVTAPQHPHNAAR